MAGPGKGQNPVRGRPPTPPPPAEPTHQPSPPPAETSRPRKDEDDLGFVGSGSEKLGAGITVDDHGVDVHAEARDEVSVDGPGGFHAGVGGQADAEGHITVAGGDVAVGVSGDADVLGVNAGGSAGGHIGTTGAGYAGTVEGGVGNDDLGAGTSESTDGGLDVGGGSASAHVDSRSETHVDVLGAHVEAGFHAGEEAHISVDDTGIDAGYSEFTDTFGVDQGEHGEVHLGTDGASISGGTWTEYGDDNVHAGTTASDSAGVDVGGGNVDAHVDGRNEEHVDVFGAHTEIGLHGSAGSHVTLGDSGVDAGYAADIDVLGVDVGQEGDAHVGLDGASVTSTNRGDFGDDELNVGGSVTTSEGVDLTHGVDASASVGGEVHGNVGGFDVGAGDTLSSTLDLGTDGVSVGIDQDLDVDIGGQRLDVGTSVDAGIGGGHATVDAEAGVDGVAGAGAGVDISTGGIDTQVSGDLAGMHASGEFGTRDLGNAWDSTSDAAGGAWDSASDAADNAGDAANDAGDSVADAADDVGDATGLW